MRIVQCNMCIMDESGTQYEWVYMNRTSVYKRALYVTTSISLVLYQFLGLVALTKVLFENLQRI